ncbi:metallophosphoesterase [Parvimonas micra]|jgi:phosphodiesterase family protein|uniref:YfcE family phosphodiesterase n=1 Tax=Parvimonas micra TaxID=33033 RepID=UPI001E46F26B|nr:metallophosphoesterase [Parvimonas micra]MCE3020272.1 metallophosphoesterase [Parvimonas micra]
MIIAVVSDTHGIVLPVAYSLQRNKVDIVLHLGDYASDAKKIEQITGMEIYAVAGNCDENSKDVPEELVLEIRRKKFFLTHGHNYDVDNGIDKIVEKAKEVGADYALFGHTHVHIRERVDGITVLNPGSTTLPRKGDTKGYYIINLIEKSVNRINLK